MKIRFESLDIPIDDHRMDGSLLVPAAAVPGMLFVHGWGGSQEQDLARAREAAELGCACMTFDLRGHSRTKEQSESVTREDNLRDLLAAYDWFVAQRRVEKSAVGLVGTSYGAYLAAIVTSMRPVRWLALRVPALYKDQGWDHPKRQLHQDPDLIEYRRRTIHSQENRALGACAAFRGDVLIVASEHDDLIPRAVIANYIAAFAQARSLTTRVISGADHALSTEAGQRAYTVLLVNWLTEMVLSARGETVAPEVRAASTAAQGEAVAENVAAGSNI